MVSIRWLSVVMGFVALLFFPFAQAMMMKVDTLVNEAQLKVEQGDLEGAAVLYHQALQMEDLDPSARLELAKLLIEAKTKEPYAEHTEMVEAIERNVRDSIYPSTQFSLNFLNNAPLNSSEGVMSRKVLLILKKIQNGDNTAAVKVAQILQAEHPGHPVPYNLLGLAWQGNGNLMKAQTFFSKALKARENFHAARINRAELNLHLGNFAQARQDLNDVLADNPSERRACLAMARLCLLEQKLDSAKEWYSRASERY